MNTYNSRGFTVAELTIVIVLLGLIATLIFVLINPLELFAKGRDAERKTSVAQLGTFLQTYYTVNHGTGYPGNIGSSSWMQQLIDSGVIKSFIKGPSYGLPGSVRCNEHEAGGFCYTTDGLTQFIVWATMESSGENSPCPAKMKALWVYSSSAQRSGRWCGNPLSVPPYDIGTADNPFAQ